MLLFYITKCWNDIFLLIGEFIQKGERMSLSKGIMIPKAPLKGAFFELLIINLNSLLTNCGKEHIIRYAIMNIGSLI